MRTEILFIILSLISCDGNHPRRIDNNSGSELKMEVRDSMSEDSDTSFVTFWDNFIKIVESSQIENFKKSTFDSVSCRHVMVSLSEFLNVHYVKVFDEELRSKMKNKHAIQIRNNQIEIENLPEFIFKELPPKFYLIENRPHLITKKLVNIRKQSKISQISYIVIVLEFIRTKSGYKFSGYDKFGS